MEDFEAIARLSDLYGAPDGRAFVAKYLPASKLKVKPARLLKLSLLCQVPGWFKVAFVELAVLPLECHSAPEISDLPQPIIIALRSTHNKFVDKRKSIIDWKPEPYWSLVYSADCTNESKGACYYHMRNLYDAHVHPLVADEKWQKPQRITSKLMQVIGGRNDLCLSCAQLYMHLYNRPFQMEVALLRRDANAALADQRFSATDELVYWIA